MTIYNPVLFGNHLMRIRKQAGLKPKQVAEKLGMHIMVYLKLEQGKIQHIDEEIFDTMMDVIPGFSPSLIKGLNAPSINKEYLEYDGNPIIDKNKFLKSVGV